MNVIALIGNTPLVEVSRLDTGRSHAHTVSRDADQLLLTSLGIGDGLVGLSVGIEDVQDLLDELKFALA